MKVSISIRSPSANVYLVTCPHLPGCAASGLSREEAVRRMHAAVQGYLASLDVAVCGDVELVDLAALNPNAPTTRLPAGR
jgi:predicted RNase H-like HicB family nuclease